MMPLQEWVNWKSLVEGSDGLNGAASPAFSFRQKQRPHSNHLTLVLSTA